MSSLATSLLRSRGGPLISFVRYRFHQNPGSLEQRLFRAVTEPILPPSNVTSTDKYFQKVEARKRMLETHPYRQFLRQRAKKEVFDAAEGRMMLIYLPLHHKLRESMPVIGKIYKKNVIKKCFPNDILLDVARGTKWEKLCNLILTGENKVYFFIGDVDPEICKYCIKITKKTPFLLLMGGVIGPRILNSEELVRFSQTSLEMARSQLVGTLDSLPSETLSLLSSHQNELSVCLEQLASSSEHKPSPTT